LCFDCTYKFCLKNVSFREELSEIWSKMYNGLHVKWAFSLTDFNGTRIFAINFRKIVKYKILWKSIQWKPSCSMRTHGQTWWSWYSLLQFCERARNVGLSTLQQTFVDLWTEKVDQGGNSPDIFESWPS
jgi:hypothetical protein